MIIDSQNLFSDEQAVTAAAASTNLIDLGTERRPGTGENLYIVAQVDEAFTDAGSDSTLLVELESDDNVAFSSPTVRQTIGTFAALAAAGSRLIARYAPETLNERFIRLKYTPANGNLSTGKVTAFVTKDIQAFTAYPDGFTIS